MLASRKGLTQKLVAARSHEKLNLHKMTIDSLNIQPTITGYGVKSTLEELITQLADLRAQVHSLKDRPELLDAIQTVIKDLTILWER